MGLDFIHSQTGGRWKKRWDGGLDRLKLPRLLDMAINESPRTLTVSLLPNTDVKAGDHYLVECSDKSLTMSRGIHPIGRIDKPPEDVCVAIVECGGYAEGIVQRVGLFGDTAEVQIQ